MREEMDDQNLNIKMLKFGRKDQYVQLLYEQDAFYDTFLTNKRIKKLTNKIKKKCDLSFYSDWSGGISSTAFPYINPYENWGRSVTQITIHNAYKTFYGQHTALSQCVENALDASVRDYYLFKALLILKFILVLSRAYRHVNQLFRIIFGLIRHRPQLQHVMNVLDQTATESNIILLTRNEIRELKRIDNRLGTHYFKQYEDLLEGPITLMRVSVPCTILQTQVTYERSALRQYFHSQQQANRVINCPYTTQTIRRVANGEQIFANDFSDRLKREAKELLITARLALKQNMQLSNYHGKCLNELTEKQQNVLIFGGCRSRTKQSDSNALNQLDKKRAHKLFKTNSTASRKQRNHQRNNQSRDLYGKTMRAIR